MPETSSKKLKLDFTCLHRNILTRDCTYLYINSKKHLHNK